MNNESNLSTNSRRYIVMDIVFYAGSLNYDQGAGNYQELKKITKWDGRQYTLVSRYALRYSLLKTAEDLRLWENAPGTILERAGEGGKTVIQPSIKSLLSGEILTYPEYDFFGYLITSTTPQNFREAPVKISHAISMTPYNYDSHFAGNLGYARKMVEDGVAEKMDTNLFTIEEHTTYYVYTVLIDIDRIGEFKVYIAKKGGLSPSEDEGAEEDVEGSEENEKRKNTKKSKKENIEDIRIENNKIIIEYDKKNKKDEIEMSKDIKIEIVKNMEKIYTIDFSINDDERQERIKNLIKAILNLNRNIKARSEFLQPKVLILGVYKGVPYQSLKDRIILANEYEEVYEENIEHNENGSIKIKRKVVKLERPIFKILYKSTQHVDILGEEKVLNKIESFLKKEEPQSDNIHIFYAPEIKIITENP